MATLESSLAGRNPLWPGAAPYLVIGSALIALTTTAAASVIDPGLAQPGHPHYIGSGVVMTLVDLLLALGFSGLVATPAMRSSWFKWFASALLVVGSFAMVPSEALLRVDFALGNSAFGIAGPIQALGLILFGIGVIRTARWASWRRLAPLAMGLYIPLVMIPALIASHGTSLLALGGYHSFVLLVGVAFMLEQRAANS